MLVVQRFQNRMTPYRPKILSLQRMLYTQALLVGDKLVAYITIYPLGADPQVKVVRTAILHSQPCRLPMLAERHRHHQLLYDHVSRIRAHIDLPVD
jgi:hypothetical protein